MKKVCFVVLHFKEEVATSKCVDSLINNLSYKNKEIIVVDNGSKDGTGQYLQDHYQSYRDVHVLINEENLGYARGNNVGYLYAKNKIKADYIIILNNDTEIKQEKFIDTILELYKEKKYYVLGPDIYSISNNEHQSPIREQPITKNELDMYMNIWNEFEKRKILNKTKYFIKGFLGKEQIEKYRKLKGLNEEKELFKIERENVVLHGACLIFSPLFVQEEDEAFFPDTFLYFEEDILTYLCLKKSMKLVYSPLIQVYHYEDLSTNKVVKNEYQKELFKIKHQRNSAKVYLKLMSPN